MSIDSCYEELIKKLTSQNEIIPVSKKLLACNTNTERVQLVYEVLSNLNAFPEALQVSKSSSLSTFYRNRGNECFKKKQNFEAWQYYNLALLHAPLESEEYALALSNRSIVFLSIEKYNECLKDIETVFSLKYPDDLKEKLLTRQRLAEKHLNQTKNVVPKKSGLPDGMLNLQGTRNETYLCASNKLEVAFSKEMGRHIIAREDIKVGEVLVEEDPYLVLLVQSQILFSCSYCLSRDLNLLPCANCCFALYCSENCKEKALNEYHAIECPLMPALIDLKFTKLEWLALRVTIKARNDHSNWESLFKTIEAAESTVDSDHTGCILKDGKWVYDSSHYASIHTLATNIEKRSASDIFQKAVSAAVFLKFLTEKTSFLTDDEKVRSCVSDLLLLHIMTSPTNMHGLSSNIDNGIGHFVDEISIASAPYAFHSLFNHSCAPNVVRFSKLGSGRTHLFALRPIKKGMQIYDNYGSHHALESKQARQEHLKFQYKFVCSCEACINNWPTYLNMKLRYSNQEIPAHLLKCKVRLLSSHVINRLQSGDERTAIEIFNPLCQLVEELDTFAPCVHLADCQESLKQCLLIFQGLVPYGYSKTIEWGAKPYDNTNITKFLNSVHI